MNKIVSIIIPVYNVEKYLRKCLDSIREQTYQEIEAIVIDDGSPDNSPAICDEYGKKDKRFRVFHIKNGGVSQARNYGVTKASGEWIMFLDSDDYLNEMAIEKLVSCGEKFGADIVSCAYYLKYLNRSILSGHDDGDEILQNFNMDSFIHDMIICPQKALVDYPTCLVPWGKIIRHEIFTKNNISYYLDLHPHEDALLNMQLFKCTNKQVYVHLPLIYYRQRNNASTRSRDKDYFLNNKKYCERVYKIKDSYGKTIISDEEFSVLCSKYFVYGMINLWSFASKKYSVAKSQLKKYLEDDFYSEQLNKAKNIDLSQYCFSNSLKVTIDKARKKRIYMLLLLARLFDFRAYIMNQNGYKIYS